MAQPPRELDERTFQFAKQVRAFIRVLPRTISNQEDIRQLVRASGSVGANYIEANEPLGKNDFRMHIKISRREAKESRFFLRLVETRGDAESEQTRTELIQESLELIRIFSAILNKTE